MGLDPICAVLVSKNEIDNNELMTSKRISGLRGECGDVRDFMVLSLSLG